MRNIYPFIINQIKQNKIKNIKKKYKRNNKKPFHQPQIHPPITPLQSQKFTLSS